MLSLSCFSRANPRVGIGQCVCQTDATLVPSFGYVRSAAVNNACKLCDVPRYVGWAPRRGLCLRQRSNSRLRSILADYEALYVQCSLRSMSECIRTETPQRFSWKRQLRRCKVAHKRWSCITAKALFRRHCHGTLRVTAAVCKCLQDAKKSKAIPMQTLTTAKGRRKPERSGLWGATLRLPFCPPPPLRISVCWVKDVLPFWILSRMRSTISPPSRQVIDCQCRGKRRFTEHSLPLECYSRQKLEDVRQQN